MVTLWEMGRSFPKPENLKGIAELYGVSVDWLLGRGTGEADLDSELTRLAGTFDELIREAKDLLDRRRVDA
jgi:transcriptional regulator with XRE-family HTH domain